MWGSNWNWNANLGKKFSYVGIAVMFVFIAFSMALSSLGGKNARTAHAVVSTLFPAVFLVGMVALGAFIVITVKRSRRQVLINVTGESLTSSQRPGETFALGDAQLGPWAYGMSMGTALHLRSGSNRFVLGGRDYRLPHDARVDVPPVHKVDAYLWAADFDQLLSLTGRRSRIAEPEQPQAPGPAKAADATRCLLFPNSQVISLQPMRKVNRMVEQFMSEPKPVLALDVGTDTISVVDLNANRPTASARIAQVSATPEMYVLLRPKLLEWTYKNSSDAVLRTRQYTTPVLIIHFPGLGPLSLTCCEFGRPDLSGLFSESRNFARSRFWWGHEVPRRINRPADFTVSSADWLTLVQVFGLSQYLQDDEKGHVRG